jgi:hypothetical protein
MAEVASSSSDDDESPRPDVLAFPDCLNGRIVFLALLVILQLPKKLRLSPKPLPAPIVRPPKELREQIMHPLELFKRQKCFFAYHRQQQALPPLGCVVADCSPCGRVRLMLFCVAFACQRLATAPAHMHMAHMSWSWAEMVIERLTRGRVNKVQVRLQRRVYCDVRCACRASACVRCVF